MAFAEFPEEPLDDDDSFDEGTFNSGVEKRVSVIMLLDTSGSMAPRNAPAPWPIDQLNEELSSWAREVRADARLRHRAEIAMISFGAGGVVVHELGPDGPFVPAARFEPPMLTAGGVTPMLKAITKAIELSQNRKTHLDQERIRRFRPLIFMLSDGAPTDDFGNPLDPDAIRPVAREIAALEAAKHLAFFAVGVRGAEVAKLKLLAPEGYWDLGMGDFSEFLRLMSASAGNADPLSHARDEIARLLEESKK